jgi:hypothetical protein
MGYLNVQVGKGIKLYGDEITEKEDISNAESEAYNIIHNRNADCPNAPTYHCTNRGACQKKTNTILEHED